MAQHDTIQIPPSTAAQAVLLTDANISTARVQILGTGPVYIQARAGTGDVTEAGAIYLRSEQGIASLEMTVEFAGVTGANRLYAWSTNGSAVSISHA
jgi:hypothetical protein